MSRFPLDQDAFGFSLTKFSPRNELNMGFKVGKSSKKKSRKNHVAKPKSQKSDSSNFYPKQKSNSLRDIGMLRKFTRTSGPTLLTTKCSTRGNFQEKQHWTSKRRGDEVRAMSVHTVQLSIDCNLKRKKTPPTTNRVVCCLVDSLPQPGTSRIVTTFHRKPTNFSNCPPQRIARATLD